MSKESKKGRNLKRNPSSTTYTKEQRWLKNKVRKLQRHLKRHPNDKQSANQAPADYIRKTPLDYYEKLDISRKEKLTNRR
jgi:ribosomal protein S15P/S13E